MAETMAEYQARMRQEVSARQDQINAQQQQVQPTYSPYQATGAGDHHRNVTTGQSWQDSMGIFATDKNAYDQEMTRVSHLINTGTAPDMDTAQDWYGKLQQISHAPANNIAPFDHNQYRSQTATIDDIARMFGFDFSRDYANRQAEAEAQAKRNAYNQGLRENESANKRNLAGIEQGVYSALDGLDTERFLAQQQLMQNQAITGVNAGIAGDQDTRLAMNAQNIMGDIHGQANLGRMDEQQRFTNEALRLMEGLALTEQEKLAYAERLYNERLMQGAGLTMQQNQLNQNWDIASMNAGLTARGQDIGMSQFDRSFAQNQGQIDWGQMLDQIGLTGNLPSSMGGGKSVQEQQRELQNYWTQVMNDASLTGRMPDGSQTVQEQQRQFQNDLAMQQFNRPYEQLTKYEQAMVNAQNASSKEMSPTQMLGILDMYMNAPDEVKGFLTQQYPELASLAGMGSGNQPSEYDNLFLALQAEDSGINFSKTNEQEIKSFVARLKNANQWTDQQAKEAEKYLIQHMNQVRAGKSSQSSSGGDILAKLNAVANSPFEVPNSSFFENTNRHIIDTLKGIFSGGQSSNPVDYYGMLGGVTGNANTLMGNFANPNPFTNRPIVNW